MKTGPKTAYLVGAGPGDPGLITVRGRECLEKADVLVYDSLANPLLLDCAPASAERIYVGKQGSSHAMEQEEINLLIAAKAKEGKTVVRLKGGDPLVFGRGAEEALVLIEHGVPFEIVPGITSGIAAPAYAGIPPTYREMNSVLTFVTGHENPSKDESAVDWKALSASQTLVFYMGMKNLPTIASRLMAEGRPGSTPAAVIHRGTLPAQRVVTGTLENIAEKVKEAGLKPPSIIIIGDVVDLRQQLNWFERRPLFGKSIMVTRSRTQASDLAARLTELGADVMQFPTIRIAPAEDSKPLCAALADLSSFDWVIFTSTNAVDSFFEKLAALNKDSRALACCRVAAVGSATCDRLKGHGIFPDLVPERSITQKLFSELKDAGQIRGKRFLLPRADIAPPEFPDSLREEGAEVTEVEAYRTLPAEPDASAIEALRSGDIDIVTFTSSSTARNFASLVRPRLGCLPDSTQYASIGPETTRGASDEGIKIAVEAEQHNIDGFVEAILKHFGKTS